MTAGIPPEAVVPHRALRLGDVFGGTFRLLKLRPGMVLALGVLPAVLSGLLSVAVIGAVAVVVLAVALPMFDPFADTAAPSFAALFGIGALAVIALAVVSVLIGVLWIRFQGMIVALTMETVAGRRPGFDELWDRTRGMIGRVLVLVVIAVAVVAAIGLLVMAWFAWLIVSVVSSISAGGGPEGIAGLFAGSIFVFVVGYLLLLAAAIFLSVRLYPLLPVLAVEAGSGLDSVRRAWGLTRGAFFRTLGYYLLFALLLGVISWIAQLPASLFSQLTPEYEQSAAPAAVLAAMVPGLVLAILLPLLASVLTGPLSVIYQSLYYLDLVRRRDLGMTDPVPAPGPYHPGPGHPGQSTGWQDGPAAPGGYGAPGGSTGWSAAPGGYGPPPAGPRATDPDGYGPGHDQQGFGPTGYPAPGDPRPGNPPEDDPWRDRGQG